MIGFSVTEGPSFKKNWMKDAHFSEYQILSYYFYVKSSIITFPLVIHLYKERLIFFLMMTSATDLYITQKETLLKIALFYFAFSLFFSFSSIDCGKVPLELCLESFSSRKIMVDYSLPKFNVLPTRALDIREISLKT